MTSRGWSRAGGEATTLVLLRHGETPHTREKRFSGGLASANPGLSEDGRAQVGAAASWLAQSAWEFAALITSPVRRAVESATIAGEVLGLTPTEEPALAEMEFGHWDGLTFAEVHERHADELRLWLGSLDVAPPGGESFRTVRDRVLTGLAPVLAAHRGQTVLAVSHVTPIKVLVAESMGAPLEAVFRTELSPASVTVVTFHGDDADGRTGSLRLFNARPHLDLRGR